MSFRPELLDVLAGAADAIELDLICSGCHEKWTSPAGVENPYEHRVVDFVAGVDSKCGDMVLDGEVAEFKATEAIGGLFAEYMPRCATGVVA